ncbi:MAG TPA: YfhO family protein, partial [Kofleriaceae bacterium]|nr:YfhO family protein [Kofleriaceae bacterium]
PSADGEAVAPPLWRAAAAAVLVAVVLGIPAARAWRGLPLGARGSVAARPALLAGLAPARIAWPDDEPRSYADAPPDTGARFRFAYLPGRDRDRDRALTALFRRSSGAAERLLDLFGVELVLVPESVAVPAAMPVLRATSGGWVLAENRQRRARAFVAPRASWHASEAAVSRVLFPAAPEERGSLSMSEVRLVGTGPATPARGPAPSPPCEIESARPEEVALACVAPDGGYAVLLDRFAPGWSAEVDGRAAAIERADLLVRAVAVPPGRHRVLFRYRAPGLRAGAAISLGGWVALLVVAVLLRRLVRRHRVEPATDSRGIDRE